MCTNICLYIYIFSRGLVVRWFLFGLACVLSNEEGVRWFFLPLRFTSNEEGVRWFLSRGLVVRWFLFLPLRFNSNEEGVGHLCRYPKFKIINMNSKSRFICNHDFNIIVLN